MAKRNYSNVAVDTTLNSGIGSGDTSLQVADDTGWPSAPFTLVVEPDTADEEIILVGAKSGTTFSSLTRGYGGTSARAHDGGDTVKHVAVAGDFNFIWNHAHDGVDDSATVDHADLTGVSADQHHAQDHAARHAPGGADEVTMHEEVDGYGESSLDNLTTSYAVIISFTLDIPAHWNSWKCMALASWSVTDIAEAEYLAKITIDGTDSFEKTNYCAGGGLDTSSSLVFRRTGMITTGERTIALSMADFINDLQVDVASLYARAVRVT